MGNDRRSVPRTLFFKMLFGGNFYINQVLIFFIMVFTKCSYDYFNTPILFIIFISISVLLVGLLVYLFFYVIKKIKIVKKGKIGTGNYYRSEETILNHGMRQVLKHTYTIYLSEDKLLEVPMYSTDDSPQSEVTVLYLENSKEALILEGLPGEPNMDKEGKISAVNILGNIFFYIVSTSMYSL